MIYFACIVFGMMLGVTGLLTVLYLIAKNSIPKVMAPTEKELQNKVIDEHLDINNKLQNDQKILIAQLKAYNEQTSAKTVEQCRRHNEEIYAAWSNLEDSRIAVLEQIVALKADVKINVENVKTKSVDSISLEAYLVEIKNTLARYRLEDEAMREIQAISTYPLNKSYMC